VKIRRHSFNGVFPGQFRGKPEPECRYSGFYWIKNDSGGDTGATCKAPFKSSPQTNQHPAFYRPRVLRVEQPTVSKHWREKYHIPLNCSFQAHLQV